MIKLKSVLFLIEKGKRTNIEDYIFPNLNLATLKDNIFIVCDGVGGENKGEVASKTTADTFGEFLKEVKGTKTEKHLLLALNQVRQNFKNYINLDADATKMSSTLTLAVINNDDIMLAWCGDSKIYHIRGNKILWKSKDHSLVQHLLDIGEINDHEALSHPKKNIIIRSISTNTKDSDIDFHTLSDIRENDFLLLATDGIFEQVDDDNLVHILNQTNENKTELIYKKCEGFTNDNYSIYLLKFGQNHITKHKKIMLFILITVTSMIFLFAYLFLYKEESNNVIKIKPKEVINTENVDIPIFKNNEEKKANPTIINTIPVIKKKEINKTRIQDKKEKSNNEKEIFINDIKKDKKQIEQPKDSVNLKNNDSIKNTIKIVE